MLDIRAEAALLRVSPQTVRRWRKGAQRPRESGTADRWRIYRRAGAEALKRHDAEWAEFDRRVCFGERE